MKRIAILAVILGTLGLARRADALPPGEQFDGNALTSDGGGGIPFDGAPRFAGHTCNVCHTDAAGLIGLRLEADHDELFTDGWKPGQQYHLRVVLENEHAGIQYAGNGDNCGGGIDPYKPCDYNGFSIELDDPSGRPTGKLASVVGKACAASGAALPPDVDTRVLTDGTAATHNGAHMAQTKWDLCWTAPAAGTGTITAYIAAVDGDGGDGTSAFPNNTTGDDVAAGAVPLAELGAVVTPPQTGGCSAAGDAGLGLAIVIVVLGFAARGRRRWLGAAALALATAGGCVHVHPRERETLAHRNMKFAPDPAEDELDLHMQEAREGSEGGYGTSGGGCGCN